jgi:hypothetical protein
VLLEDVPYTTTIASNKEIDRWIDVMIAEMTKDKAVEVMHQYAPGASPGEYLIRTIDKRDWR